MESSLLIIFIAALVLHYLEIVQGFTKGGDNIGKLQLSRFSKTSVAFQADNADHENNKRNQPGFLGSLLNYLPGITRARVQKSYNITDTDSTMRYHIRLKKMKAEDRPRIFNYLQDIFPYMSSTTIDSVINEAMSNGRGILHMAASLRKVEEIVDNLSEYRNPVIHIEVFDTKKGEVILTA